MPMSDVPDQENWVERLQADGPTRDVALAELRGVLVRGLRRSFAKRGGGDAFIEDMAQEALLRILKALDSYDGRARFTTWAMVIAVRLAISELRRKHFQDVSLDQFAGAERGNHEPAAAARQPPEERDSRARMVDTLKKLVDETLTDKQKTAVQAALGGMPAEEIARRLNSNRNAVYKMIHDARQKLRKGMEAAGISADDVQAALT
jgi:RNA polymerase sigma-70 factor (ECF subfamily)